MALRLSTAPDMCDRNQMTDTDRAARGAHLDGVRALAEVPVLLRHLDVVAVI